MEKLEACKARENGWKADYLRCILPSNYVPKDFKNGIDVHLIIEVACVGSPIKCIEWSMPYTHI